MDEKRTFYGNHCKCKIVKKNRELPNETTSVVLPGKAKK